MRLRPGETSGKGDLLIADFHSTRAAEQRRLARARYGRCSSRQPRSSERGLDAHLIGFVASLRYGSGSRWRSLNAHRMTQRKMSPCLRGRASKDRLSSWRLHLTEQQDATLTIPMLVADAQASEAIEPSAGALHHPAVKAAFSHGPRCLLRAMRGTIPRVRRSRHRALASQALSACSLSGLRRGRPRRPLRRGGIASSVSAILTLSRRLAPLRQKPSGVPRVGDKVALRARLASIGRVRVGGTAPFLAGTDALSRLARLQSI